MRIVTDRELEAAPQNLLVGVRRGEPALLTDSGDPLMFGVPLKAGSDTQAALTDLAASLYDSDLISLGRAAEVAGLAYIDMFDELGRRGIATVRMRPGELDRELCALGA
jgi:predicted HTH domain antitoxin